MGYVPLLAVEAEPAAVDGVGTVWFLGVRECEVVMAVSFPGVGVVPGAFPMMRS